MWILRIISANLVCRTLKGFKKCHHCFSLLTLHLKRWMKLNFKWTFFKLESYEIGADRQVVGNAWSSLSQMFFKVGALKSLSELIGNTYLESLFNKIANLQTYNSIKSRLQHRCFPVNIAKFFRTAFSTEHLPWLVVKHCALEKSPLSHFHYFKNLFLKVSKNLQESTCARASF